MSTSSLEQTLAARIASRQQHGLRRVRQCHTGAQQAKIKSDGKLLTNFTSNNYLGIADHPCLRDALTNAAKQYGVGSAASHLVCGHTDAHHALEQALAVHTQRDAAILFSSGYAANLGAITALVDKQDAIFQDRLNHASLFDGGRLSEARQQRYHHCNVTDLARRMGKSPHRNKLVVTDSVFSMDGDQAPLSALVDTCKEHQAWLMVDDAHGLGVLGEHGGGCLEASGHDQHEAPIYMGTLGKALGCYGAFIAGSQSLIDAMIQFARPYIYTTALPPAIAVAGLAAVELVREEAWRREHLNALINHFRHQAHALELPMMPSHTAIQPLLLYNAEQALAVSNALREEGILVTAIRPPTVPTNSARLRITLTAGHSIDDVDQLIDALMKLKKRGLIQTTADMLAS